mmetsp:Transcript_21613/g.30281  ORF Transcript_21613/g.30281 Transcript_21613/m.30281 type:complete len:170 (+) Transcript_21613:30-539(+)
MRAVLVVIMAASTLLLAAFWRPFSMSRLGRGKNIRTKTRAAVPGMHRMSLSASFSLQKSNSYGIGQMVKPVRSLASSHRCVSSTGPKGGSLKTTAVAAATTSETGVEMGTIRIVPASMELADDMLQVINWAYRGKDGVEAWTGEAHLLSGVRIQSEVARNDNGLPEHGH